MGLKITNKGMPQNINTLHEIYMIIIYFEPRVINKSIRSHPKAFNIPMVSTWYSKNKPTMQVEIHFMARLNFHQLVSMFRRIGIGLLTPCICLYIAINMR